MSAARRDAGVKQRSMAGILARDHFAWVERIAQPVADVVDGEHSQEDRGTREEGPVRREVQVVLGVEEDASPRGNVGREAEAEEGERGFRDDRSEEHTSELQSLAYLVCRLLLEKKK